MACIHADRFSSIFVDKPSWPKLNSCKAHNKRPSRVLMHLPAMLNSYSVTNLQNHQVFKRHQAESRLSTRLLWLMSLWVKRTFSGQPQPGLSRTMPTDCCTWQYKGLSWGRPSVTISINFIASHCNNTSQVGNEKERAISRT